MKLLNHQYRIRGRSYEDGKKKKTIDGFLYLFNTLKYKFLIKIFLIM